MKTDVEPICRALGVSVSAYYQARPTKLSLGADGDPPDGTTAFDGWALFSGTSAAAPQVAGAAACVGDRDDLGPARVRQSLRNTAI
jgi:subtilisin family serine protease